MLGILIDSDMCSVDYIMMHSTIHSFCTFRRSINYVQVLTEQTNFTLKNAMNENI